MFHVTSTRYGYFRIEVVVPQTLNTPSQAGKTFQGTTLVIASSSKALSTLTNGSHED